MNRRIGFTIVCLCFVASPALMADETTDKLDCILEEIRSLKMRVGRLEAEVRSLSRRVDGQQTRVEDPTGAKPRVLLPRKPMRVTPAEVIRMQIESPDALMKEIHQRERILRQRPFLPELPIQP